MFGKQKVSPLVNSINKLLIDMCDRLEDMLKGSNYAIGEIESYFKQLDEKKYGETLKGFKSNMDKKLSALNNLRNSYLYVSNKDINVKIGDKYYTSGTNKEKIRLFEREIKKMFKEFPEEFTRELDKIRDQFEYSINQVTK